MSLDQFAWLVQMIHHHRFRIDAEGMVDRGQKLARMNGAVMQVEGLCPLPFCGKTIKVSLLKVNDLTAAVLAGDGQTRFAAAEGAGNFSQGLLGAVVGLAQVSQDDMLKVAML